ncbi:hypothetical protein Ddye_004841 [Dipteronia dyeriana]|uniref:Uncharacterized protein n=1 Tax=Dipteronia dyeriana TaxID=168575 RepID=A0AAD9XF85_9ROSI|nr:hypothetical protein Ddye_004841 [Dipteronia dyeriana]
MDRGLYSRNWRSLFPKYVVRHLQHWGSDHRPMCLDVSKSLHRRKKGMRFYLKNVRLKTMGCKAIVDAVWETLGMRSGAENVLCKIDRCGRMLSSWSTRKIRDHHQDLQNKKEALKKASRKARFKLNSLFDEGGTWKDLKDDLELIIDDYLKKLICTSSPTGDGLRKILNRVMTKLDNNTSWLLVSNISGEEVRKSVFYMNPIKAPSSDGLSAIFYHKYRDSIGPYRSLSERPE